MDIFGFCKLYFTFKLFFSAYTSKILRKDEDMKSNSRGELYESPRLTVSLFDSGDVIATSKDIDYDEVKNNLPGGAGTWH